MKHIPNESLVGQCPFDPPQSIGALPNFPPTAPYRGYGNCAKEHMELVIIDKSTTSVGALTSTGAPLRPPPATKYLPCVKWKKNLK